MLYAIRIREERYHRETSIVDPGILHVDTFERNYAETTKHYLESMASTFKHITGLEVKAYVITLDEGGNISSAKMRHEEV